MEAAGVEVVQEAAVAVHVHVDGHAVLEVVAEVLAQLAVPADRVARNVVEAREVPRRKQ